MIAHRSRSEGTSLLTRRVPLLILGAFLLPGFRDANAATGVVTESVDNYSLQGSSSLPNSNTNSQCFQQGMTGTAYVGCNDSPGTTPFTYAANWVENNVYDSDFIDNDLQLNGNDSNNFDRNGNGNAIGYFTGHGICQGCEGAQSCSTTSQCTNPVAGHYERMPGTCRQGPPGSDILQPTCCYATDVALYTSSPYDSFGHRAVYSTVWSGPPGRVAWGESTASGGWAGAGTNGGVNLVVLDISCGVQAEFWFQQLQPAFAGLQFLATVMPIAGDTDNVPDRGSHFAQRWQRNSTEPMANAWTNVLNDLPQTEGSPCAGSDYSQGGGHGINGCGCNFITSFDTQSGAYFKMKYGDWSTIQSDAYDGVSNSYYYWYASCNYNTSAYPWQL